MNRTQVLAGAALAALLFMTARRANASQAVNAPELPALDPIAYDPPVNEEWALLDDFDSVFTYPMWEQPIFPLSDSLFYSPIPEVQYGDSSMSPNLQAFLYMIRSAEHSAADVASGADYTTFFGGSKFSSMWDHPVLTGEKRGVRLSDDLCRKAGFGPGCVSTAAGGYQINVPTWVEIRAPGEWGPALVDFSRQSQDEAARRLLILTGALPFIEAGDFASAVAKAAPRWASLPGNKAGQGKRTMEFVMSKINDSLAMG